MCCKVKVAIYSFFFHAIVAVASTADLRGKISAVTGGEKWFVSSIYN